MAEQESGGSAPRNRLLDELESIKNLLEGELHGKVELDDIPLLHDVIAPTAAAPRQPEPALLDLDSIFRDDDLVLDASVGAPTPDATFQFPRFTLDVAISDDSPAPAPAPAEPRPRVRPDYSRDLLIQELVDEFIPQIEAALRERLGRLDTATLQAWRDEQP